ncbi:hypothetical protein B296_00039506, partial [Ensete ventricosum]
MARRCSHCNHNGHNSRTCPNRGVKLFGVHLTDGSVRKSASMGNLSLLAGSSGGASPADGPEPGSGAAGGGYASEDFVKGSSSSCRERKKGEPPLISHTFCLPFFLGLVLHGPKKSIECSYLACKSSAKVIGEVSDSEEFNAMGTLSNRSNLAGVWGIKREVSGTCKWDGRKKQVGWGHRIGPLREVGGDLVMTDHPRMASSAL